MKSKIVLGLSVSCQLAAKLWIMVWIANGIVNEGEVQIDLTKGLLLLVMPIPIGWATTILLHALLKTDLWLLSKDKDNLIHLLSTTWVTLPVRRMGDRDQRHKGRETFFALLLAGLNLVGTSAAAMTIIVKTVRASYIIARAADVPTRLSPARRSAKKVSFPLCLWSRSSILLTGTVNQVVERR